MDSKNSLIGRRLYAFIIDMLMLLFITFLLYILVVKIFNDKTNIQTLVSAYKANMEAYNTSKDPLLYETIVFQQNEILSQYFKIILITITSSSLIVFLILPLALQKGRTLGKVAAKLYIVNKDDQYVKFYILIIRQVLYIIINIILGLLSLGIIPLINLLVAVLRNDDRALYDIILNLDVRDGRLPLEINNIIQ